MVTRPPAAGEEARGVVPTGRGGRASGKKEGPLPKTRSVWGPHSSCSSDQPNSKEALVQVSEAVLHDCASGRHPGWGGVQPLGVVSGRHGRVSFAVPGRTPSRSPQTPPRFGARGATPPLRAPRRPRPHERRARTVRAERRGPDVWRARAAELTPAGFRGWPPGRSAAAPQSWRGSGSVSGRGRRKFRTELFPSRLTLLPLS